MSSLVGAIAARTPDFFWGGMPVYRCRYCAFERIDKLASVLHHEAEAHPPVTRVSPIVGPDGQQIVVQEGRRS